MFCWYIYTSFDIIISMNKLKNSYINNNVVRVFIWFLYAIIFTCLSFSLLLAINIANGGFLSFHISNSSSSEVMDITARNWYLASLASVIIFSVIFLFLRRRLLQYTLLIIYALLIIFTSIIGIKLTGGSYYASTSLYLFTKIPYLGIYLSVLIMFIFIYTKKSK